MVSLGGKLPLKTDEETEDRIATQAAQGRCEIIRIPYTPADFKALEANVSLISPNLILSAVL